MTAQEIWDDLWGDSDKEEIVPKSSYNSMQLAQYFQEKFMAVPWQKGFGIVNLRALSGALTKWKTTTDSDTVKQLIDIYMEDQQFRGVNPGWKDFLYHAEKIAASILNTGENTQGVDKWSKMEEEWEQMHGST
jgi:hypothetical protein